MPVARAKAGAVTLGVNEEHQVYDAVVIATVGDAVRSIVVVLSEVGRGVGESQCFRQAAGHPVECGSAEYPVALRAAIWIEPRAVCSSSVVDLRMSQRDPSRDGTIQGHQ